jgi:conjugal transfer pilus assembly protein TraK
MNRTKLSIAVLAAMTIAAQSWASPSLAQPDAASPALSESAADQGLSQIKPGANASLPAPMEKKKPVVQAPDPAPKRKVVKLQDTAPEAQATAPLAVESPTLAPSQPLRPRAIPLPGVGKVDGDPRLLKANLVRVTGDGTEMVQISSVFQNRIATPFDAPRVIDSSDAQFKVDGSNIFITPVSDRPIVIYVTGSDRGDPVVSITLTPNNHIPAQTIILQLDPSVAKQPEKQEKPASYEEKLRNLMRTVALGRAPEGYSESPVSNVVGRMGPLAIAPQTRYSGTRLDVYTYRVENQGDKRIDLSESSFYQKGVRAVGLYPSSSLEKNESTYLYVVSDKSALEDGAR